MAATTRHTKVWDPLVRTVHWSVASLIVVEMLNEASANPWHRYLGYAVAVLVVIRLAWGFGSSPHARLAAMAASVGQMPLYLRKSSGSTPASIGHTPPGALMAFILWAVTLLVAATGWMQGLDRFWGDERLQQLHEALAYVLSACALVHVAAALATSRVRRVNLVKAMITGTKPLRS
jgi:cytochrome b